MWRGDAQDHKHEIIMHYNDNWKWGWRPRQASERIYRYEFNRHWTSKLCSQTHSAYNYQQALPFIISLVLLHAKNSTFFHSEIFQSFVSRLLKIKPLYQVCKTHAQIWSWSAQTHCTPSQPISFSFQSHTTHCFVNVYCMAISFNCSTGHNMATVQEQECIQKLSTMRQKIIHVTVKKYLNCILNIFSL